MDNYIYNLLKRYKKYNFEKKKPFIYFKRNFMTKVDMLKQEMKESYSSFFL